MEVPEDGQVVNLTSSSVENGRSAPEETIIVAATFTAEPIAESLAFWTKKLDLRARLRFAPYNQLFQHLLGLDRSEPDDPRCTHIILPRLEDWQGLEGTAIHQRIENVQRTADEFLHAVNASASRTSMPHLVCFCPPSMAALEHFGRQGALLQIERELASRLNEAPQIEVITYSQLFDLYPVLDYEDEYALKIAHIPYTPKFFVALGTMIARRMHSLRSAPRKVIAVDCDNTLWNGVCGEEGATGVCVDPPRRTLQDFLIGQHDAGMLLCLVTKNAEDDVNAVFADNSGMRLRPEHIISSRINWRPKPVNLRELADELNLGLDSFIFIDDNPLECAEVRATSAEVLVLELPADAERIPTFVRHVWAFDHWKVTSEDTKRNAFYRQERAREEVREQATTFEDFLALLDLKVEIRPAAPQDWARLSQLTERTNQFNFAGLRRSAGEISKLSQDGLICLSIEVADRFGDYGLVGFLVAEKHTDVLAVDTFLLSCRVLGRGVEHRMLAHLASIALEVGLHQVYVRFVPTSKNQPARNFLESLTDYRDNEHGNSDSYYFRASALTTLKAVNSHAPVTASLPVSNRTGRAAAEQMGMDVLAEIAENLSTVEQIAHAIESNRVPRTRALGDYSAPRTRVELTLNSIWSAVLHIDRSGIHDNFFGLGGDSLLAVQMLSRIRHTLQTELPLRTVFEAPTIAELASRIEAGRSAVAAAGGESQSEPCCEIQIARPEHDGAGQLAFQPT